MFKNFFDAIRSLFSSLFGSSRPRPGADPELDRAIPQDGSEIRPDTIIVVADEMEHVVVLPSDIDKDFDKDIFEGLTPKEDLPVVTPPKPQEEPPVLPPVAEPKPTPVTPPPPTPTPTPQPTPPPTGPQPRYLWCLDAGHGRRTAGKRSPVFELEGKTTQFLEYEFNRDIIARMIGTLDEKGVRYFITVPEVDIDDFLQGRVDRANSKQSDIPKLFVSIHANAAPAPSANSWCADSIRGIETWHFHGSKTGQKIAGIFQRHLIAQTGFNNRHLKSRPQGQFFVLRRTNMPAILTENGFYNNRLEVLELMKPEVRQKIADAHVEAILEIERDGL
jgi:N-acetylmuramoyl-L-alanine amidase